MAISRERKEELVAQYSDLLSNTNGFVIVQTKGLTVKQVQDLRAKIRAAEGDYVTTKNTLFRIALENGGWPVPHDLLHGPVSVAFGLSNFPGVAKAVLDFTKDLEEKMKITGGVMTGEMLDARKVETISKLPSLDELRAQLAGLLVQPATGLVSVLNAATGQIVNVLHAYVQENEKEGAA